jgi:hypothetical protein
MSQNPPSALLAVRQRRETQVTSRVVYREDGFVDISIRGLSAARIAEVLALLSDRAIAALHPSEVSQQAPAIAAVEIQFADPGEFIAAKTELTPQGWTPERALMSCYRAWAVELQQAALERFEFAEALKGFGLRFWPRPGGPVKPCGWLGVRLLSADPDLQPADVSEFLNARLIGPGGYRSSAHETWQGYRAWAAERRLPAVGKFAFDAARRLWEDAYVPPEPMATYDDRLGHVCAFLAARTETDLQAWIMAADLWTAYQSWANGQRAGYLRRAQFGEALRAAGLRPNHSRRGANGKQCRTWEGARLRTDGGGPSQLRLVEGRGSDAHG